ncbi:MAG: tRNA 2-thiocytidine biosynthesis protein TtcA [Spirochaetales bacterium]|nr:tRNA 2-thiocytidine biosynthesis protein TtcA [Spirochaetales bacterium]
MSKIETRIARAVSKVIFRHNMIEENDRILVAVSGGKDSLTLLHDLKKRQRGFPVPYTILAYHLETDFCGCCAGSRLKSLFEQWEVPYRIDGIAVRQNLKPGQELNCFSCSTSRRIELLRFARQHGFNKIALGHHQDDIIETTLLNLFYKGEFSSMLPVITYDKEPQVKIIRPLALVREEQIVEFSRQKNFNGVVCTCPYGRLSKRKKMKGIIRLLSRDNPLVRYNILASVEGKKDRKRRRF